jgi:hypothetical protein
MCAALAGLFACLVLAACEASEGGPETSRSVSSAPVDHSTIVRIDAQSGSVDAVIPAK